MLMTLDQDKERTLLDRDDELETIDRLLQAAGEGLSGTLVLRGEPGIVLTQTDDIELGIRQAFERIAHVEAGRLFVETRDGTLILEGIVNSWAEHDAALAAAWAAPGATMIEDRIRVEYPVGTAGTTGA